MTRETDPTVQADSIQPQQLSELETVTSCQRLVPVDQVLGWFRDKLDYQPVGWNFIEKFKSRTTSEAPGVSAEIWQLVSNDHVINARADVVRALTQLVRSKFSETEDPQVTPLTEKQHELCRELYNHAATWSDEINEVLLSSGYVLAFNPLKTKSLVGSLTLNER
jgi:hypothetical protein